MGEGYLRSFYDKPESLDTAAASVPPTECRLRTHQSPKRKSVCTSVSAIASIHAKA